MKYSFAICAPYLKMRVSALVFPLRFFLLYLLEGIRNRTYISHICY